MVVFIDTEFEPDGSDGGPGLRVLINDSDTYTGIRYALGEQRPAVSKELAVELVEIAYVTDETKEVS